MRFSKNIALSFASLSLLSLGIGESTNANLKKNFKDLGSCSYETAKYEMKYEKDVFLFGKNREKGRFRYCITKNNGIVLYTYHQNIDGLAQPKNLTGVLEVEDTIYEGGSWKKVQWSTEKNALVRYSCVTDNSKSKKCKEDIKRIVHGYKRNALMETIKGINAKFIKFGFGSGKITHLYQTGDIYEGDWSWGKANGKGIYIWSSGNKYEGDFVNGNKHGKGTLTWANGEVYIGDFTEGKRTGKGTYTLLSGSKYVGDFIDGKATGKGTYTWKDGEKYVGDFLNGKRSGKGTFNYASGNKYEGEF